jgi:hypothetical protein
VTECGSDVGVTGQAQGADREIAETGHDPGRVAGTDVGGILAVGDVPDVVELVVG